MNKLIITEQGIQSEFPAKPDESINVEQFKKHYEKYPDRWNSVFKFLKETDLRSLEIGRIDLNENVYAAVSEYETKNHPDALFESHREYVDLQYVISGEELIGLTNDQSIPVSVPYSEEKDITFYSYDGGKLMPADPTRYFIFFPDDIHRPCLKVGDQKMVRKIVLKIRYNE
ncbi:YhcH/YjgK/YiaL family protein [Maribellus sediminis]|uniref:YhcH/YjgK/YiaL family protein n=1 Tax=Maribellus sediminis TaxID=2696285 RepID=UPI0014309686|nr:YhcH/YjgK/YiaL family protein [Maribellus sediminis]